MKPLSAEEREDPNHLFNLAWDFMNCHRASLWKVREDLWEEALNSQNYESERTWHPGLCLGIQQETEDSMPIVTMTLGTTGRAGPLVLRGVTDLKGTDYPTSFGALIGPVPGSEFVREAVGADRNEVRGWWGSRRRVSVNWHKRYLTPQEEARLEEVLPKWLWE